MGSQAIHIFCRFPIPNSHNHFRRFLDDNCTNCETRRWRYFPGCRSSGSRWDWEGSANPNRRSRFRDAYATDEDDEDNEFGFRNAAKQRVWWSDEDDDDEDDGFGILEASIGFSWVSKIFQAFGWMIPAVVISLLMGTGPNSIVMALALPLAQSAFSLAADTLWGRADETPRPKSKRKKRRSSTGARKASSGYTRVRNEKEYRTQMRREAGNYKSWSEGNNRNGSIFGGWDELDDHVRENKDTGAAPMKEDEEEETRTTDETLKISRRTKDTPLFLRFLIAMFPFLGFFTKLF